MEASWWFFCGIFGFVGFVIGACFGAWVVVNAFRFLAKSVNAAIAEVVSDEDEFDDADEWKDR